VVSSLAYPNLLGNKMLGCCCYYRVSWSERKMGQGNRISGSQERKREKEEKGETKIK
jgi:hypothetical protein